MKSDSFHPSPNVSEPSSSESDPLRLSWPMRFWSAAPDWFFRAFGFAFMSFVLWSRARVYFQESLFEIGPFYQFSGGDKVHFFWAPMLVDLTLLLVGLSFLFRMPPRNRNANGAAVSVSLLAGVWPFLPFALAAILGVVRPEWRDAFGAFTWRSSMSLTLTVAGTALLTIGNALDVWGYSVLFRSFSVVPEARELKTNGPYRWVRHPVYLGQILAQAGVWLVVAQTRFIWIGFYLVFVLMLLYRTKLEDRVLEKAFGDPYRDWKRRTFWFV